MQRSLFSILLSCGILLMACSSQSANDGRAVSERILFTSQVDSTFVDTTFAKLDTIITPEIFGRDFAMTIVKITESDTTIRGAELHRRVQLLQKAYTTRGNTIGYKRFAEGVQSYINGLPLNRQMHVYARISTPAQLGTALRIDRFRNPNDTIVIAQANALRAIYTDEEWNEFQEYYNRK